MKKPIKIILIVVAAALALAVLVPVVGIGFGIVKDQIRYSKPANYYADVWNITFPESAKETYTLGTDGRDWWRYSIYTIDPGDDTAFADYSTAPMETVMFENMIGILEYVQVPQEQRPDLERSYQWKHIGENESLFSVKDKYMDNLYVLYDEETNTVYTLISHR